MASDVCADCHNKGCEIQTPIVAKWELPASTPSECAYSSCGSGLKAARAARNSGPYEYITLAGGTQIQAVMFETPEKETLDHYPRRCCTRDGVILGETEVGYKRTGQTLYTRDA